MSKRVFASSWSTSGQVCEPVMSRRLVSGYRVFMVREIIVYQVLGFALDPNRQVAGKPFIELLSDRLNSVAVKAELRSLVTQHPTAVIGVDLDRRQLAATTTASVTTVLYWKVLQWAGYSKEKRSQSWNSSLMPWDAMTHQAAYTQVSLGGGNGLRCIMIR